MINKLLNQRLVVSKTRMPCPSEANHALFQASLSSLRRNRARSAFKRFSQQPAVDFCNLIFTFITKKEMLTNLNSLLMIL